MSFYRVNLLKLIDLAIGSPGPGSVSFGLLHKILYILALREKPQEWNEEIELQCQSGTSVEQTLLAANNNNGEGGTEANAGTKTRLTVQRVQRALDGEEQRLRITGSRILVPWEDIQTSPRELPELVESRMSDMSSVVSNLEERVQEISRKPSGVGKESLNELRKRMDYLEGMIEQQITKLSAKDTEDGSNRPPEDVWEAIKKLEDKLNDLVGTIKTGETGKLGTKDSGHKLSDNVQELSDAADVTISENDVNPSGTSRAEKTSIIAIIGKIESRQKKLDQTLQTLMEQIENLKNGKADHLTSTDQLGEQIAQQLAKLEESFASRIQPLESAIDRLFQEKANDVQIESRIRQSVRLMSIGSLPQTIQSPVVDTQHLNDQLLSLTEQLQSNRDELQSLRSVLESKPNQEHLTSAVDVMNDQIKALQQELKALRKQQAMDKELAAAGGKPKPPTEVMRDVRCISCDRAVTMDRCDEVVPKPPAPVVTLGVSRVVKPSLRSQLHEIRKTLAQEPASGTVGSVEHWEKMYRRLAAGNGKPKRGQK